MKQNVYSANKRVLRKTKIPVFNNAHIR